MRTAIFLYLVFVFSIGCNNRSNSKLDKINGGELLTVKFDKAKWSIKKDNHLDYTYRDEMLNDLLKQVPLKGVKKYQVLELLGQPDRSDTNFIFYRIAQQRIGFFPVRTKTLVIKFTQDSTVEWRKIHE